MSELRTVSAISKSTGHLQPNHIFENLNRKKSMENKPIPCMDIVSEYNSASQIAKPFTGLQASTIGSRRPEAQKSMKIISNLQPNGKMIFFIDFNPKFYFNFNVSSKGTQNIRKHKSHVELLSSIAIPAGEIEAAMKEETQQQSTVYTFPSKLDSLKGMPWKNLLASNDNPIEQQNSAPPVRKMIKVNKNELIPLPSTWKLTPAAQASKNRLSCEGTSPSVKPDHGSMKQQVVDSLTTSSSTSTPKEQAIMSEHSNFEGTSSSANGGGVSINQHTFKGASSSLNPHHETINMTETTSHGKGVRKN